MAFEEEIYKKWTKIIKKIWDNPSYRDTLMRHPEKLLKEHGIEVPHSMQLHIHENSEKEIHFVIPQKPPKELSEEALRHIVAGLYYGDKSL